jgi:ABC-type multidrug transport system permease subunit
LKFQLKTVLSLLLIKNEFMIQRIQTLFLLLAAIAFGLLPWFKFATFISEFAIYELDVMGFNYLTPETEQIFNPAFFLPIPIGAALILLLAVVIIFLYKNRPLQMRLVQFEMLLTVVYVTGLMFFYIPAIEKAAHAVTDYRQAYGVYLILAAMVFFFLANRFIRKDEALVKSVDRLR